MIYHIQQGGSSAEVYLHMHCTQEEADTCRKGCDAAAYNVGPDRPSRVKLTPAVIHLMDERISDAGKIVAGY